MSRLGIEAVLLAAVLMPGCGETANTVGSRSSDSASLNSPPAGNPVACCPCGHKKGAAECCAADACKCASCDKRRGSALCGVELPADQQDKSFCSCGWARGSPPCCDQQGEVCSGCGMRQGSTRCCKIRNQEPGTSSQTARVFLVDEDKQGSRAGWIQPALLFSPPPDPSPPPPGSWRDGRLPGPGVRVAPGYSACLGSRGLLSSSPFHTMPAGPPALVPGVGHHGRLPEAPAMTTR